MASTFYSQIGANKRNSVLLALAVVLLLGLLGLLIGWAVTGDPRAALPSLAIAIGVGLAASLASYYLGDSLVLASSGAREVTAAEMPQLYNVVGELTVAAGLPMPRVYLIDDTAPNAFATGRDPGHASVAITTGLLQKLDREELQGVMAHELSHVRNFDIRFSLMVGVLVGSIALLADFFLRFSIWGGGEEGEARSSDSGGGGLQAVIMVVARSSRSSPHRGAHGPDGRQPPARVPRGRLGGGAHPQPERAGAGAREDRARTRSRWRSPIVRPSTSTSRTRSRPPPGPPIPVLDAPAGPRPDQSIARADGAAGGGRRIPGAGSRRAGNCPADPRAGASG